MELTGDWVCSVCGSRDIDRMRAQAALGDPAHPLARCGGHSQKSGLSPLCRPDEFRGRRPRRAADAPPDDVFGALPDDEKAALARPIRLL